LCDVLIVFHECVKCCLLQVKLYYWFCFRVEGHNLIVHFNLHFDPRQLNVGASDLMTVLSKEIALEESRYLSNITIDPSSLEIKGEISHNHKYLQNRTIKLESANIMVTRTLHELNLQLLCFVFIQGSIIFMLS
jgi:hypothetical protein